MKMKARLVSGFTGAVLMLSAVQLSSFPAFAAGDDGEKDYSDLYNMEKISSEFAKFYGTEDSSTPEDTSPRTDTCRRCHSTQKEVVKAVL